MTKRRWYTLEYAVAIKETGPQYPQVQRMGKDYDYDAPNSIHQLAEDVPQFSPNLDHFVLHRSAKPTDLVSNGLTGFGFIVSDRFKKVLLCFNLPAHEFYPAKILHNRTWLTNYYWLQIGAGMMIDLVDYKASEFYVRNIAKIFKSELGSVEVFSKGDFENKRQELKSKDSNLAMWAKKIVMNNSFSKELDMFSMTRFNADTFISDRLKKVIDEAKLTGLEVKPTELIH